VDLPRRAFLGAHLGPDAEAFSDAGMLVDDVIPGAMASDAGVGSGDRILRVAGAPVRSLCELGHALRVAGAATATEIAYERGGVETAAVVDVLACPTEHIEGARVDYGCIESRGARLRTITTRPDGDARGTVLIIQGIACDTVDFGPATDSPLAQLVASWTQAGFATIRTDKPGIGDSTGGPCRDIDFESELDAHRAALGALTDSDAGPPVYLFGHSIGGMVAALLACERAVDGIVVYGTSTMKWIDCIVATTRRQLEMRGASAAHIAKRLSTLREQARTEGLNGRSALFHTQLHTIDLEDAWQRAEVGRVLVARGRHDWVVSPEEQARIAELTPETTVIDIPGLDHVMGWHPDEAHSMSHYGAGRADATLGGRIVDWMVSSGA
jgi:hypothetical protein